MKVYLDASVVLPILVEETTTPDMERWLSDAPDLCLSEWTIAECSSALSHRSRTMRLTGTERNRAEDELDRWRAGMPVLEVNDGDITTARVLLRMDPVLRTPDALHLAIVERHGIALATYDRRLASAARSIGVVVISP